MKSTAKGGESWNGFWKLGRKAKIGGGDFQSWATSIGGILVCSLSTAGANMKLAVLGLAMTSLLLADQAQAQTPDNRLRGINQFNLMILALQGSGEHWKECQITETLIRDVFMLSTSGARFVVNEGLDFQDVKLRVPLMYIDIGTKSDQLCVSHIDMRMHVGQEVKLEASGRNILAPILLWTFRTMRSSAKDRHRQVVREVIDETTKKFITDWNLDNK